MTENALHSLSDEKEKPNEAIKKMQIALSAELYGRALQICQRRNCSLEAVLEDLIERFLPPTKSDDQKFAPQKRSRADLEPKTEPNSRWIRNKSRKRRFGW